VTPTGRASGIHPLCNSIAWLDQRINYERSGKDFSHEQGLNLGAMRRLLRELGNPEQQFRVVHVAGTKGKGSTVAMIAAVLAHAGHNVGHYLSPHVHGLEERIGVRNKPILKNELEEVFTEVIPVVEKIDASTPAGEPVPTWFEVLTAIAFFHFARVGVDLAVVETGLGGRLDATNLSLPVLTLITSIGLDHTRILGDTISAIAREKAGIIKEGCPVISATGSKEADQVIESVAIQKHARSLQLGRDFECIPVPQPKPSGQLQKALAVLVKSLSDDMPARPALCQEPYLVGMAGVHQIKNAGLAVIAIRMLSESGWPVSEEAMAAGLRATELPARISIRSDNPLIIIDAAHNEDSMKALIEAVFPQKAQRRPCILVFAASQDKQIESMLAAASGWFDHVILTQYHTNPRAASLQQLAIAAQSVGMHQPHLVETPKKALALAKVMAQTSGLICVAGSFFLAAEL